MPNAPCLPNLWHDLAKKLPVHIWCSGSIPVPDPARRLHYPVIIDADKDVKLDSWHLQEHIFDVINCLSFQHLRSRIQPRLLLACKQAEGSLWSDQQTDIQARTKSRSFPAIQVDPVSTEDEAPNADSSPTHLTVYLGTASLIFRRAASDRTPFLVIPAERETRIRTTVTSFFVFSASYSWARARRV